MTFDWRNPDYAAVFRERLNRLERIRAAVEDEKRKGKPPFIIPMMKLYYRDHPADFISDFGVTYDPRNADIGLPTVLPFILFPKQVEWIEWVLGRWRARRQGLCEKSRDMGVTWTAVGLSCALCLFHDGMSIGFGSRKAEYVDKIGDMKSILPKARMFMEYLPEEFRGGFVSWRDAPKNLINFPETGSQIGGEAGDDIGRGDRRGIYFFDEAQPLAAKIMTPEGWKTMADMRVGIEVTGRDGLPTRVTSVRDCGVTDVFRFTFSDGTSAECSPNHLWTVQKFWGRKEIKTLRAHEIAERYRYESPGGQVQYRYRIPVCQPVQFHSAGQELPMDPYLVGALLGDGSVGSGTIRITTTDHEIADAFLHLLPSGVTVGSKSRYSYNIVDVLGSQGYRTRSRARLAVHAAGIRGMFAQSKAIPDAYKFASPHERISLLQGLMDTDGYAARGGTMSYHTSSPKLAEDIRFLVQSLGGTANFNVRPDRRGYRTMYALQIYLPASIKPFRLARKLNRMGARKHPASRTIVAVERIERKPVRCISVDNPDQLYLTDHFIVTHNCAHHPRQDLVEAALSQTTNCQISMTSVRGMNNLFAQKRWSGKFEPIFIFDWRDHPAKDEEWYKRQVENLDPVVVAQEIDRDYSASVRGVVIPGNWVRAAIDAKQKLGIAPAGKKRLAFDVADEGEDQNAICIAEGTEVLLTEEWSGKGSDIFESTEYVFDTCDDHDLREFRYDADGVGADVRGDARVINERRRANHARQIAAVGYRGSEAVYDPEGIVEGTIGLEGDKGRTNEDYFGNRKAQSWWALRKRFQRTYRWVQYIETGGQEGTPCAPDDIISLSSKNPELMKLVAELSQATYKTNELGKIIVNKKPTGKAGEGMKSPNQADAVVIDFAPMETGPMEITGDILQQIARAGRRR